LRREGKRKEEAEEEDGIIGFLITDGDIKVIHVYTFVKHVVSVPRMGHVHPTNDLINLLIKPPYVRLYSPSSMM
jgi:hypothetical protein